MIPVITGTKRRTRQEAQSAIRQGLESPLYRARLALGGFFMGKRVWADMRDILLPDPPAPRVVIADKMPSLEWRGSWDALWQAWEPVEDTLGEAVARFMVEQGLTAIHVTSRITGKTWGMRRAQADTHLTS